MVDKKSFKQVQVQDDHSVKVVEAEIPEIKDDSVLVKVEAAGITVADIAYVKGLHLLKPKAPYAAGWEGSGTVVGVGKNHSSRLKVGDRVSFATPGAWSQYIVAAGNSVFHIHPDNTFEDAASHYINHITLVMMLKETQKEGHKAIVHSAGASSLGKMLIRLFKENGIKTINLVRRDDVKEELIKMGADYVLNIKDEDFEQKLEEVVKKENPTKFFDAIGGDFTVKVLRKMPPKSITSVYGFLSQKTDITVSIWDLFAGKTLKAFAMTDGYLPLSWEEKLKLSDYIQERLKTTLRSDVIKTFPLEKAAEAIVYSEENASKGKTLLKPWE